MATMNQIIPTTLFLLALFVPYLSVAQEEETDPWLLMQDAVKYSAQADAYGIYCEKEAVLAAGFIKKFEEQGRLSEEEVQELTDIKIKSFKETYDTLKTNAQECKEINFMTAWVDVMKQLKDVSYLINGVDPETVPKKMPPEIGELLGDL